MTQPRPDNRQTRVRVIRRRRGIVPIDFGELVRYHELLGFLTWRDVLVRYKQTAIGVAWAAAQPVLTMIVFTVVFGRLGKFPSHNESYAVMTFAALLPWQFFANAITQSSQSVVQAGSMITKIYFPRILIPTSATAGGIVDFLISVAILFLLMIHYGVAFRAHLLLLPVFSLVALAAALGVGFWFSALNVQYRDVKHVVPFLVRLGLFVCPVGFSSSVVPETWRYWYSLNPMVGVIDGFRWAILGPAFEPYWPGFWASLAMTALMLVTGAYFFRRLERTFADVI